MVLTEADTCRTFVVPKLQAAGWDTPPHTINEQRTFTDGRIFFVGRTARRGRQKRADYLLRYRPDFPIAVVEAKARYKHAAEGLQQAKDYAEILGLKFAYATNGAEIIEFDYTTGVECRLSTFPKPDELWQRLRDAENIGDATIARQLLQSCHPDRTKPLRYYQEIALNRAVQAILQGQQRSLLTLCTGAGKTAIAFQVCWKLWSAGWNTKQTARKPKILFLADRNVLVDDPMAKDFRPFGDARHKIAEGQAVKSRDIYFALYQTMAGDENRPGLYREYPHDFFDLVIVDECHRGSARDDSNWRNILEWFAPAIQLGMTATPLCSGLLVVSQPKGWEGAVAVCDSSHEGWYASPEYRTFRCKPELLDNQYLAALLPTPWFQRELTRLTRGQGARRERLRPEMLLDMKIRMPAIEIQRVALRSFGRLGDLRAERSEVEEDIGALLPAMLHGIFREPV